VSRTLICLYFLEAPQAPHIVKNRSDAQVPPCTVNSLQAAFQSFDVEAKDVISNINRHASAIDNTAVVVEMEKADMSRKRRDTTSKPHLSRMFYLC
jgi:hypothetical protein